jgi:hypothetical protein
MKTPQGFSLWQIILKKVVSGLLKTGDERPCAFAFN